MSPAEQLVVLLFVVTDIVAVRIRHPIVTY